MYLKHFKALSCFNPPWQCGEVCYNRTPGHPTMVMFHVLLNTSVVESVCEFPQISQNVFHTCGSLYSTDKYWSVCCAFWIIQRSMSFIPSKCILFLLILVLTFYFFLSISFFDKGEGGEERQQRQCSMEEEITQEIGGKHCCVSVSMYAYMHTCTFCTSTPICVYAYIAFTCAYLCVWEIYC